MTALLLAVIIFNLCRKILPVRYFIGDENDAKLDEESFVSTSINLTSLRLAGRSASSYGCGLILGAFGDLHGPHMNASLGTARNSLRMRPGKGWCPADQSLEHIPVTLITDVPANEIQQLGQKLKDLNVLSADDAFDHFPFGEQLTFETPVKRNLGPWKYRFYHCQMLVHAPYSMTMYLDSDATVCSANGLRQLFSAFGESGADVGYKLRYQGYPDHGYGTTYGNKTYPRPNEIKTESDLKSFANLSERNAGVIMLDSRKPAARKLAKDWCANMVQGISEAQHFNGDQFPLREAIWQNRKDLIEFLSPTGNQGICREEIQSIGYSEAVPYSCESGCAVIHNWKFPEIYAMARGLEWEPLP